MLRSRPTITMFCNNTRGSISRMFTTQKVSTDYSKTLHLPKTTFPMRANASETEKKFRKICSDRVYEWQKQRYEREGDKYPLWVTHDGPPYANGPPHIGHALNKILKDVVNRYRLMKGHTISYIPGWDCHGLPIETKAVKENKHLSESFPSLKERAMAIRGAAKKVAADAIKLQKKHFQEWGVMGEWEKPYLTLQPAYESAQLRVFFELYQRGLIYQGVRPVHWSPSSKTALAEAELEYPEKYSSLSVFCSFPIEQNDLSSWLKKYNHQQPELLIWTTTPWTLPANLGICVNPTLTYSVVSIGEKLASNSEKDKNVVEDNDTRLFIVANSRIEYLQTIIHRKLVVHESVLGEQLVGMEYRGLMQKSLVYAGDFVSDESGTGLVHAAPGHGQDDFKLLTGEHGLPAFCPVDDDGKFTDALASNELLKSLVGESVLGDGNRKVIEILKQENRFLCQQYYAHKYPHDWRTKQPVITRATKQWFTDLRSLIPTAVESLDSVEMIPSVGKNRFSAILKTREDWCISRQRVWGVPLPVFIHKLTKQPLLDNDIIDHLCELVSKHGMDCWWNMETAELLPASHQSIADQYEKNFDTVDVWFDSGVSWAAVLKQKGLPTADLYLEGSDQHRGWFQSSLLTSIGVGNGAPFKRIVTHGFVMDGNGRKMSKSEGNVVDPAEIIYGDGVADSSKPAFGADVLRLWVGSVDFSRDVLISNDHIHSLSDSKRKIRNTTRYMLGNISDLKEPIAYEQLFIVDKYMLAKLHQLTEIIHTSYETFTFQKAITSIFNFCYSDLSAFYFESIKDRVYADALDSLSRRSAQTTLAHILVTLTKAIAPVLCHTSEEIFQHFPKHLVPYFFPHTNNEELFSVFQTGWIQSSVEWKNDSLIESWDEVIAIRSAVHAESERLRNEKVIKQAIEADVIIELNPATTKLSASLLQTPDLHLLFNVSNVKVVHSDADQFSVKVTPSTKQKCARCWLQLCEPNEHICSRCHAVINV